MIIIEKYFKHISQLSSGGIFLILGKTYLSDLFPFRLTYTHTCIYIYIISKKRPVNIAFSILICTNLKLVNWTNCQG